jgi:hypothetical protein
MSKTKNPNDVGEKSFSDSLELFDSLFQEELESGAEKPAPPKRTTAPAPQKPPSKKLSKKEDEEIHGISDKEKPDGLAAVLQAKKTPPSTKPSDIIEKESAPKITPPGPEQKSVSAKKTPLKKKRDTLKMKKKGAEPPLEPEQPDEEVIQESEFEPGMIRMGNRADKEPFPAVASPEKVGKLYTPKESKNLIPNISVKESNLYKVALTGFAVAIVVMVLINFFGLIGSKEPQKPSIQKNKSVAQKASTKKRSNVVAKKPENPAPKTAKKSIVVQKSSPKPVSSSPRNQVVQRPSTKRVPPRKTVVAKSSPPQSSSQTNRTAKGAPTQNLNSQQNLANPPVSPGASATVITTARNESDAQKSSPGSSVPTPPKTKTVQASSPPSSSTAAKQPAKPARVASIDKMPSYPYSVYLGAYKTLDRARKAVSQYQKKGVTSYWVKVDLGRKGIWHRLFTGYFPDGGEALDFISEKDLEEASVKKTKYTTLIGVYSSEDAIIKKSMVLDKLGYSSYVVDGGNGTAQLYSGAFITKGGAEKYYQELAAKGIRNRVVER